MNNRWEQLGNLASATDDPPQLLRERATHTTSTSSCRSASVKFARREIIVRTVSPNEAATSSGPVSDPPGAQPQGIAGALRACRGAGSAKKRPVSRPLRWPPDRCTPTCPPPPPEHGQPTPPSMGNEGEADNCATLGVIASSPHVTKLAPLCIFATRCMGEGDISREV